MRGGARWARRRRLTTTPGIHAILNYNGENVEWNKKVAPETDALTHVYTFVVRPDNTYSVLVDDVEKESGNLVDDWELLEPREIPDPEQSKPEDWVDGARAREGRAT